jgi:hypothetical protein
LQLRERLGRLAYWCGQLSVKQPLNALLVQFQPGLPNDGEYR